MSYIIGIVQLLFMNTQNHLRTDVIRQDGYILKTFSTDFGIKTIIRKLLYLSAAVAQAPSPSFLSRSHSTITG